MRRAIIDDPTRVGWGGDPLKVVQAYLPRGYEARMEGNAIVIEGEDNAGWTMDGYVLPRLASAMIYPRIEEPT
jgi:hypothetical protein